LKTVQKKTAPLIKKSPKRAKQKIEASVPAMEPSKTDARVQRNKSTHQSPACIFITGESPLVEQCAELCSGYGYSVSISWNEEPAQRPEFKSHGIKITRSIPANTSLALELTNIDIPAKKKNLEWFGSECAPTPAFYRADGPCSAWSMGWVQPPTGRRCGGPDFGRRGSQDGQGGRGG